MPQQTVTTSKKFSLNINDFTRGLLMAVITPVLAIVMDSLNQGSLTFNVKLIVISALAGGIAYLIKNFGTPAEITIKNAPEATVESVKDGDSTVKVVEK